jgi:2-polyprenyl-3-methyl-5-hydroxy-6-metoxy-1,4-benzoquinol methylase
VLVIGCGMFHELQHVSNDFAITAIDIDPRVIAHVARLEDRRIAAARVVPADPSAEDLGGPYDAIYAKELIEHIVDADAYLRKLHGVLQPGGRIWLSTPNYGEPWLPWIERTALEWVARRSGFSRSHIHPTRFSRASLGDALSRAGFADVRTRVIRNRLALVARARRA